MKYKEENKSLMEKKKIAWLSIALILLFMYGQKTADTSLQNIDILGGFGYDIIKSTKGNVEKIFSYSVYNFKSYISTREGMFTSENPSDKAKRGAESTVVIGKGMDLGEIRQNRQLTLNKNIVPGVHKITIYSEDKARDGIDDIINLEFTNSKVNDRSTAVVCKGKAEDMLRINIPGYQSSSDYIEGVIVNSTSYNFLAKEYNLLDIYLKLDTEGRNLVMPYVETKDKIVELSGMAVFKGEKMAYVLPMNEARIMNMMRENNVKGILTIQDNSKKYINYDTVVKRKIKCNKVNEKYNFEVNLSFNGDIIENTMFKDINEKEQKQISKLMENKIEEECNRFISNMQNKYKMDFLDLGIYAVAKYGRDTGVDWNEVVSNSDITVKVKVKVDKFGMGLYGS